MTNTLVDPRLLNREVLFLAPSGRPVFSHLGADGEENSGDDSGEESDEDSEDSDDDESDDEGADDKNKDDKKNKKTKRVIDPDDYDEQVAHKNRIKKQLSESDKKRAAAEKKLADLEKAKLPDAEKAAKEVADLTTERDGYRDKFLNLARTNAFLTASAQEGVAWADPEDAQAIAGKSLRELDIDDDGNVDGIRDLVKSLARKKPHLVKTDKISDEGDGEDKDKKRRNGASGTGVGSRGSRGNGKKETKFSEEDLVRRFPALRR